MLEDAHQKHNCDAYRDGNRAFHKLMVLSCGNRMMEKAISDLIDSEKRMRMLYRLFPEILDILNQEHALMIVYLRERQAEELENWYINIKSELF